MGKIGFFKRPSAKRAGESFNLSKNQLRIMTGLQTGHCPLKGHNLNSGSERVLGVIEADV